jgi:hypothetical protein
LQDTVPQAAQAQPQNVTLMFMLPAFTSGCNHWKSLISFVGKDY